MNDGAPTVRRRFEPWTEEVEVSSRAKRITMGAAVSALLLFAGGAAVSAQQESRADRNTPPDTGWVRMGWGMHAAGAAGRHGWRGVMGAGHGVMMGGVGSGYAAAMHAGMMGARGPQGQGGWWCGYPYGAAPTDSAAQVAPATPGSGAP